jgi:hypothetical protein
MINFYGFVFGWSPNGSNGSRIYFNGFDTKQKYSIDFWPPDFALDAAGDASEILYDVLSLHSTLLLLLSRRTMLLSGTNEDEFTLNAATNVGIWNKDCSAIVEGSAFWLGNDKRVHVHNSSQATPISFPIDSLLMAESDETWLKVKVYSYQHYLFLIFPHTSEGFTRLYIYDSLLSVNTGWYKWELPFIITSCGTYSETAQDVNNYLIFGLSDGRIVKMFTSDTDLGSPIEASVTLNKFHSVHGKSMIPLPPGIWLRLRSLHVAANQEKEAFIDINVNADDDTDIPQGSMDFDEGVTTQHIRITGDARGKNLKIILDTIDPINIQGIEIRAEVSDLK